MNLPDCLRVAVAVVVLINENAAGSADANFKRKQRVGLRPSFAGFTRNAWFTESAEKLNLAARSCCV